MSRNTWLDDANAAERQPYIADLESVAGRLAWFPHVGETEWQRRHDRIIEILSAYMLGTLSDEQQAKLAKLGTVRRVVGKEEARPFAVGDFLLTDERLRRALLGWDGRPDHADDWRLLRVGVWMAVAGTLLRGYFPPREGDSLDRQDESKLRELWPRGKRAWRRGKRDIPPPWVEQRKVRKVVPEMPEPIREMFEHIMDSEHGHQTEAAAKMGVPYKQFNQMFNRRGKGMFLAVWWDDNEPED
jgi:hypothetical protein